MFSFSQYNMNDYGLGGDSNCSNYDVSHFFYLNEVNPFLFFIFFQHDFKQFFECQLESKSSPDTLEWLNIS